TVSETCRRRHDPSPSGDLAKPVEVCRLSRARERTLRSAFSFKLDQIYRLTRRIRISDHKQTIAKPLRCDDLRRRVRLNKNRRPQRLNLILDRIVELTDRRKFFSAQCFDSLHRDRVLGLFDRHERILDQPNRKRLDADSEIPDIHRQWSRILRHEIHSVYRRTATDRDQDVCGNRHVQHLLNHDLLDLSRDLSICAGAQREHRRQVRRNRAVLELNRILEINAELICIRGGTDSTDDSRLKFDHHSPPDSRSSLARCRALYWRMTSVLPAPCNGSASTSSNSGEGVTGAASRTGWIGGEPSSGLPSGPGVLIHFNIVSRSPAPRSRVTGMWFGSRIGNEKAS